METIKTDRLILRKPQKSDSNLLFTLLNDELIGEYINHLYFQSLMETTMFIHRAHKHYDYKNDFFIIIEESKSKDIIGIIDAFVLTNNSISIAYAVKNNARGNGYMPESLIAFIQYLQTYTDICAAEFSIRYDNASSRNVMKKLNIPITTILEKYIRYELSLKEELPW